MPPCWWPCTWQASRGSGLGSEMRHVVRPAWRSEVDPTPAMHHHHCHVHACLSRQLASRLHPSTPLAPRCACAGGGLGGLLGGWIGDCAARRFPDHGRIVATQFSVIVGVPFALLLFKVGPRLARAPGTPPPTSRHTCLLSAAWPGLVACPALTAPGSHAPPLPRAPRPAAGPAHGRRYGGGVAVPRRHHRLCAAHRLARALLQQPRLCRDRARGAAQPHLRL